MKRRTRKTTSLQRVGAFALALVMVLGIVPAKPVLAADTSRKLVGTYDTVADPDTVSRPVDLYGTNTMNAGKVTVGKSVSDTTVNLTYGSSDKDFTPAAGNFIVTSSQTAQVLGLASESPVPVDVVFVLDTSNSMDNNVNAMVSAANSAIETLLTANENNRVGVVAFSGTQGGGTSNGAAANTLSPLAYYSTNQSNHLYIRNGYLYGRGTTTDRWGQQINMNRDATSSGTNIHAGVVAGARLLMEATNTTINIGGTSVTRLPFLIVMSDGQPSYASDDSNWYDPDLTQQSNNLSNNAGVGFLPALTAAYYKGKITEKYFNSAASDKNRCFVYTLGLGLEDLDRDQRNLALMTVDPAGQTSSNTYYDDFEDYWEEYQDGQSFNVNVGGQNVNISSNSITATTNAVNAKNSSGSSMGYTGGYVYNDEYFSASQGSQLESVFGDVITTIQKQALSSPTHVEQEHGADFSGYVTYTDPLGEYMEVKDVHGILVNGKLFEGKSFAQHMQSWNSAPTAFKSEFAEVLQERCKVTGSTMDVNDFISKAVASENQAYYRGENNYDNSLVWWGRSYDVAGEIDDQVQWLGFADNDTVEYITNPATTKPNGATHICRSYYFYGTAGDATATPAEDLLHFVVRVQRELEAPYRETVVVSAPASLLSIDKVFVTEKKDNAGNPTYEAEVEKAEPARVVYEVGLRSDINAYNVAQIVGEDTDYIGETTQDVANGAARSTNYSVGTDGKENFTFYTNDWNRAETEEEHHRAMTHVTFKAAADNSFYTYTDDTLIYIRNGDNYTVYNGSGTPAGTGYYYARDVYDWAGKSQTNGVYTGVVKRTEYIPIDIPVNASVFRNTNNSDNITNGWYVRKGVFKASSLTGSEDIYKRDENGQRVNPTGTAVIVSHPHRTDTESNSHYTVLLGNNGKLTLTAEKTKHVSIEKPATTDLDGNPVAEQTLTHADGKPVMVGDILTYTIDVINPEKTAATATVTDTIPTGTVYVDGSATGAQYDAATGKLTWANVTVDAATSQEYGVKHLTFKVKVTEDALKLVTVDNTAYVDFGNNYTYETNTVKNPPEGKTVTNTTSQDELAVVPNVLEFNIHWVNDSGKTSTVTITDKLPTGTTFISASDNGKYENGVITWELKDVLAGKDGVVSFRANVNPNVEKEPNSSDGVITNKAEIEIGENDPRVVITNDTITKVKLDDLVITKEVTDTTNATALGQTFELNITEVMTRLNGDKTLERYKLDGTPVGTEVVTFVNGSAQRKTDGEKVTIQNDQAIVIKDIPVGSIFSVTEVAKPGFTPSYYENGATAPKTDEGRVTIKENTTTDVKNSAKVDIKNKYSVAPVKFQMQVTKQLTTAFELGNTEFGFTAQVYDIENNRVADDPKTTTGEVTVSSTNKTATFTFPETAFNAATGNDPHYVLITETNGGVTGVTYTERQYLLKIEVDDDGSGQLSTNVSYKTRAKAADAWSAEWVAYAVAADGNSNILFTNTYAPKEVTLNLEGTKNFSGRTLLAGEFSFVVTENGAEVSTGTNDEQGNITFKPITYKTEGTHTYYITETNGGKYGVTYSQDKYKLVVEVDTDTTTNHLRINKTLTKVAADSSETPASGIAFTNTYDPDPVKVELKGTKTLVNNSNRTDVTLADQQFAFVVKDESDNVVATGNNAAGVRVGETNTFTAPIVFSPIVYHVEDLGGAASKTFTYTVEELVPDLAKDPNMYYADNSYTVSVTVSYDATTGILSCTTPAASTDASILSFQNTLEPATFDVVLGGKKTTNGLAAGVNPTFSFVVKDMNNNIVSGGTSPANGMITFTSLTYNAPTSTPDYFWIYESNHAGQTAHGITYSGKRYLAEVTVTRHDDTKVWGQTINYYAAGEFTYDANGNLTSTLSNIPSDYTSGTKLTTAADVTFTNVYNAAGIAEVTAKKVLVGNRKLNAGDFRFELKRMDNDTVLQATNDASGNIKFPSIPFASGDFGGSTSLVLRYEMREVVSDATALPGITPNGEVYYVQITATDDTHGNVSTVTEYFADSNFQTPVAAADVKFVNTYAPKEGDTAEIEATKVLTGRELREGEFIFDLYHKTTDAGGNPVEVYVDTAHNMDTDGDGQFNNIKFVRSYPANILGSATEMIVDYVIKERNNNLGGIGYDVNGNGNGYPVTVRITNDPATAKLNAVVIYQNDEPIEIVNKYTAQGTDYTPVATKTLKNRELKNGEFSFVVQEKVGTEWKTVSTGTNAASNTLVSGTNNYKAAVNFTPIGFGPEKLLGVTAENGVKSKTFTYRVMEVVGNLPGVNYDETKYYLQVTISDDGSGVMNKSVQYFDNEACGNEDKIVPETVNFTNTYHPDSLTFKLEGDKILTGRDAVASEFSFTVKRDGKIVATGGNAAAKNGEKAAIVFTDTGLSLADLAGAHEVNGVVSKEITYVIEEQTPTQGGVTVKTGTASTYYAKVTLTYNTATGELTASDPVYSTDAAGSNAVVKPVFENTYTTNPVTLNLPVDKTLVGKQMAADEFTFTVKEASLDAEGNLNIGATAKDENGNEMIAKNKASGEVEFGKLKFTAPGTYIYQVEEDITSSDAAVRDCYTTDVPVVVVVTVEDDLLGHLIVNAKYHMNYKGDDTDVNLGSVEFVNYYTAPPLTVPLYEQIGATKDVVELGGVTGNYPVKDFTFKITDATGETIYGRDNAGREALMIGTSNETGKITFPFFHFENAGEYRYWIAEQESNKPGIVEDARTWEIRIVVSYNEQTGKLEVRDGDVTTFLVGRAAADETNKPAFVNVYQPAPKIQTFTAKKELVGRDLRDREFTFQMLDANGLIAAEAHNDADGNINFQIEYTEVGTYQYTIVEVEGNDPYVKYNVNNASFGVTVKVADEDLDGQFEIAVSYADSNRVFTNKYTPDPITVPIYANKTMTGDKEFAGEQFSFQLKEKMPVDGGLVLTQKNDTNGLVTFNVTLGAGGQYIYTLSEIKGTDSHITYDTKSHDVVVDVVDDGYGKLTATVTYPGEENAAPVFVNQYKADPYLLTLEGTKELTGRKMTEGEFNFVVHDSEGTQVATAKNDADGKLVFSNKVKLPEVGNYTLTVSEVKGTDTTVTYDETKFTVTATVTNNNGVLEAEVKYPEGGIAFVNKYEEPEKPTETTKPAETTKPTEPKAPGAPDTGDHANVLLYGVMAVVSLGAAMAVVIALLSKKRRRS